LVLPWGLNALGCCFYGQSQEIFVRRRLVIFDSTLREGAQLPESLLLIEERVAIAAMLERLNVDVIEAGFAGASREGFLSVQAVSRVVKKAVVCSLCRPLKDDVDTAVEALSQARRGRIHIFLAAADPVLRNRPNMSRSQVLQQAVVAVEYARSKCADIQITIKDAGQTEQGFLIKLLSAVIQAGASTVILSDPSGHCLPEEMGALVRDVRERVRELDRVVLGVHVRDDLGLALASTIAAIDAGVQQVECTINGVGDGFGICALEGLVNALKVRQDYFAFVRTDINEEFFLEANRLVARALGTRVPRLYAAAVR
jgi:2-isopropylmalate synthase